MDDTSFLKLVWDNGPKFVDQDGERIFSVIRTKEGKIMTTPLITNAISYLYFTEDENYQLQLQKEVNGNLETIHLFKVLIYTPFEIVEKYVLAQNENNAIGQARCGKYESYNQTEEENKTTVCIAKQLPLRIRGYTDREF